MMNIIIQEDLHDKDFIEKRTEGFQELEKTVKKYSPEKAEKITGVPKEKIVEAARLYGQAENAALFFSMGITQHTTGVDNVVSIANLAMLTGNIGRPGTGVNPLRGQNNVQGACDMAALPDYLPGYQNLLNEETRSKFTEAWGVEPPKITGLTMTEMVNKAGNEVKALFILGENPLMSDPDLNHAEKSLKKLEFLVVAELFMSETAEIADVILPATSFAEKDGTYTATDRRVQLVRKAIDPIGETRPDWWIIQELSKRLGYNMDYAGPSQIMDEINKVTPIYGGIQHKRLEKEDLRWPCINQQHLGTRILHQDRFTRGKGRFQTIEYKPPAEETDDEYPYILTTGRLLYHWHTGTMTRRSTTLTNQVNEAFMEINPIDAKTLGIDHLEIVTVSSRRGEIQLKANVTYRIKPGVVFIAFHYVEAAANRLTINALDPVAKIPEFKVCAVKIRKI